MQCILTIPASNPHFTTLQDMSNTSPLPVLSLSLSLSPLSRVACWSAKPSHWLDCVPLITPAVDPSVTVSHLEDSSTQNSSGSFSSHVLSTSSPEPCSEALIETRLGLRTQQALVLSPLISVSLGIAAHCRKAGLSGLG